jgi:hypothetical protein
MHVELTAARRCWCGCVLVLLLILLPHLFAPHSLTAPPSLPLPLDTHNQHHQHSPPPPLLLAVDPGGKAWWARLDLALVAIGGQGALEMIALRLGAGNNSRVRTRIV